MGDSDIAEAAGYGVARVITPLDHRAGQVVVHIADPEVERRLEADNVDVEGVNRRLLVAGYAGIEGVGVGIAAAREARST